MKQVVLILILCFLVFVSTIFIKGYRSDNIDKSNSLPVLKPNMVCDIFMNDSSIGINGNDGWHKFKDGSWGCARTPSFDLSEKDSVIINFLAQGDQFSVKRVILTLTATADNIEANLYRSVQIQMFSSYAQILYHIIFNKELDQKIKSAIFGKIEVAMKQEVSLHNAYYLKDLGYTGGQSIVSVETENKPNFYELRLLITKSESN
jgi:hypothetical protein